MVAKDINYEEDEDYDENGNNINNKQDEISPMVA